MAPTIHALTACRPRPPLNTDFFTFLCPLRTPGSQHLMPTWEDSVSEAPMIPDFVPHDSHAADPQARAARRKRLTFAVVAAAVLVAVIAWVLKPASQSASGPGGRGADGGRPIPVRA